MAFAKGLGEARHITVTPNGLVYVKLSKLKDGKGTYVFNDNNSDGISDATKGFGNFTGTGIAVKMGISMHHPILTCTVINSTKNLK